MRSRSQDRHFTSESRSAGPREPFKEVPQGIMVQTVTATWKPSAGVVELCANPAPQLVVEQRSDCLHATARFSADLTDCSYLGSTASNQATEERRVQDPHSPSCSPILFMHHLKCAPTEINSTAQQLCYHRTCSTDNRVRQHFGQVSDSCSTPLHATGFSLSGAGRHMPLLSFLCWV